ncbi:hypothetical protein [Microbulbifer thermotolerans]|uniref:hypothetical protein n=1 Tax=Microbulbifer thermotolerans TaxID=252514 RepID=UPI00224AB2FA|nr:hypothetical protein [Microbulbifer thermotolerans]MCX2836451.1 hypothetical protein [Microbulbifer thermotolerans]
MDIVDEELLEINSLNPAWASEISQLEFCIEFGKERVVAGLSSPKKVDDDFYLLEVFSPSLLSEEPGREPGEVYYRLFECRNGCEGGYRGQTYILIRSAYAIYEAQREELFELLDFIDCVSNSECLKEIFNEAGFFKKVINGWRGDIKKILAASELKVVGVDLVAPGEKEVEIQVSSDMGAWKLVFEKDVLPKKRLLELNVVQY